jgi:hypothetical protein
MKEGEKGRMGEGEKGRRGILCGLCAFFATFAFKQKPG